MTSAYQLMIIPAAFTEAVQAVVAQTGALEALAYGNDAAQSISYDDLDRVPEIAGPLLDLDSFASGEPFEIEDLKGNDFYPDLFDSKFSVQQKFLQDVVSRRPPKWYEVWKYATELKQTDPFQYLRLGTAHFHVGITSLISGGEERAFPYRRLDEAQSYFMDSRIHGAAAIIEVVKGEAIERSKEDIPFREEIRGGSFSNASHLFLRSFADDAPGRELGANYLYGLYTSKASRRWENMQGLFQMAGMTLQVKGYKDQAVLAYLASLWAFTRQGFAEVDWSNDASWVLWAIEKLAMDRAYVITNYDTSVWTKDMMEGLKNATRMKPLSLGDKYGKG